MSDHPARHAGLYRHSLARGVRRRFTRHEIPKQFYGIGAKRAGNGDEFDDVEAPLAALIFGDERLRLTELLGQRLLPDT